MASSSSGGGGGEAMLCRITQSHWKEGEMVPTYFVSQKPRKGHFQRLKDALQQAPMYSRIEIIGGGTFREKLVLDKPVEIGVAKAAEMPTIVNKGTGVVCQVDEALLEGIRIEAEDSTIPCVTVVRGSPRIRWCVLQAVEVSGTASPIIEECKILDSKTHGLFLTDRAAGTYSKNSIWGHSGYSVQIESHAEPTLSYNVIAGSELGQVCIQEDPEDPGRVAPYLLLNRISDDSDISKDVSGGAGGGGGGGGGASDAFSKATATSSSNVANEHGVLPAHKLDALPVKRVGMKVAILPSQHLNAHSADFEEETSDDPTLMENVTSQHCAVLISGSQAQPTLVRNTIASCKHHGMTIRSGAAGVYETNYVSANKGWGIIVQGDNTAPLFKANHVGSNGGGVRIFGSPASFVGGNSFFGNRGPQLVLHDGHPRFLCEANTVKSGNRTGVLCMGTGTGTFRRNHFDGCAIAVRVESLADPVFDHDIFEQCRIGVYVREGGLGQFVGCHITDIVLYGALVMSLANPVFQGCQFVFNETGAVIMRRGRGTFEGCCFRDCRDCGIEVSTESHPIVSQCEVKACQRGGVRVRHNGRGTFTQNLLVRNHEAQLLVAAGGDPVVTANVVGFTEADGVRVVDGGLGTFVQNVIQSCYQSGVVVSGALSAPVIRANQIAECGLSGIQISDGRLGTYEKNIITRCCRACISVEGHAVDAEAHGDPTSAPTHSSTSSTARKSADGLHKSDSDDNHNNNRNDNNSTGRDLRCAPVVLRSNFLYHTSCCGVIAERRASVLVHRCVLRYHEQGVIARSGSDLVVVQSVLRDCTHGVCADEESALQLFANVFSTIRGTAAASLSTSLFQARANTFTHCGTALLLRRVGRGVCLENTIRQSTLYGILLGTDCRCVVTRNILFDDRVGISFAELHNRADVFDNCIVHALEQGIRVSGDAMDAARCRQNVVLTSKVGVFVRLGGLRLEYNLLLNCEEGLHVNAVPGKHAASAMAAGATSAAFNSSTKTTDTTTFTGSLSNAKRTGHRLQPMLGSSPQNDLVQTGGGPSAQLRYCYVSCCSRGVVSAIGGGSVVAVERTLFTNNDVGFHIDGARASIVVMRACVLTNSAAAGLYAQACPSTPCLLEECALFKNFINVVSIDGAAPDLRRCVLEAPVVFNVFVSGVRTSPRLTQCLICPRADVANLAGAAVTTTAAAASTTTTARKVKVKDASSSATTPARFNAPGLNANGTFSGLATTYGQPIEALLTSIVTEHATVSDPAQTGARGGGAASRAPPPPSSAALAAHRLDLLSDTVRSWLAVPSLWTDHYTEPLAWQREPERDHAVELATEPLQSPRGQVRAQLVLRRRSAILWPANVEDTSVLGGPGGPFIVHRMRVHGEASSSTPSKGAEDDGDGDDMDHSLTIMASQRHRALDARHRDNYLYSCSGLWLEHASTPLLESCYIGEHVSVGTGFDRPVALPEEHGWSLSFLPFLGEVRTGPAAASVLRLRSSATLAPLTAPYVPPFPETTTDTLLGQLLLVGSPCFWRRHAVMPLYFQEQCPLLAEAITESATQLVRKRQFENFSTTSIHYGAGFTSHLVGTGLFARHYAEGDVQNCTLARNTAACRLSMGAKTSFKTCQLVANAAEAFVLEGHCTASIQNCSFREGRFTQIQILGVATAPLIKQNTFVATAFTSIAVSQKATPRITANQFTSVQSAAIVVETHAEPFLEKNNFEYCQGGVEYRSGARGRLERNHFKGATRFAILVKDANTAPALVGNTMLETRTAALHVVGHGAQPYVEDNVLTANDIGIFLQAGAQGTYLRNTLRKHRQGVVIEDSQGYFRGNTIAETHLEGVIARGTHAAPVLLANRIQDGESIGLRWENGQGQIGRNRFLHNADDGCVIEGNAACPAIVGNEVAFNGGAGVRVRGGSAPVLHCNVVASNSAGGVCIEDAGTSPVLEGDYIKANHKFGVLFDKKAAGSVSACVISATVEGPAVVADDGAKPVLQELAVVNNTAGGIVVRSGASVEVSRCLLAHNRCLQSSPATPTAALVVASSEEGSAVAGCVFLENDLSVLALRGARVELTACGFFGAHSGSAAARVQAEAAPLFTHCLFASTRCAVSEDGAGRYTRCQFVECATGADVSGPSTFYECEYLECGTGLRVAAGASTVMGCIMASCTKVGLHLTGDARASIGECGILRNVRGVLIDGSASGTVSKSRILWNTDNVVVNDQATTTVTANLIYDSVNSGVLVRSGAPTISNNDIFDNHYAGVTVESALGGRLEENRVSFAREDGALVVRNEKESLAVAANTLRNSFSPPANALFRSANERQQGYRKLGTEKEKDSVTYAALRVLLEEIVCLATLRLSTLQAYTVGAASNKEWVALDNETAVAGGTTTSAAPTAPSSGRRAKEAATTTAAAASNASGQTHSGSEGGTPQAENLAPPEPVEEPISKFFEPLHARWEKLSPESAAAARYLAFPHLCTAESASGPALPESNAVSPRAPVPDRSAEPSRPPSRSLSGVVRAAASSPADTSERLPPIAGGPAARRVTREGLPTSLARRGSHVDATDAQAMTPSASSSSSTLPQRRPGTRAGDGSSGSRSGSTAALTNGKVEDLLPPAATLVTLFHVKRALQRQLDQLDGTPNATPSHQYTSVLHRPTLQTVSAVLDSDAFRAVLELHRSLSAGRPLETVAKPTRGHTQKGNRVPGASATTTSTANNSNTGTGGGGGAAGQAAKKKRKSSSFLGASGDGAAALRLPAISTSRGARKDSAASIGSAASTSQQRSKRAKRKSSSTILGDNTTGKPRNKKKKAAT